MNAMKTSGLACAWVVVMLLLSQSVAFAQAPSTDDYDKQKLRKYFKDCAKEYKITVGSGEELQMQEQPLMNTRNNERLLDQAGSMFLWEFKSGRPAAIIMVFTYWQDRRLHVRHELLSLSNQKLEAYSKSKLAWEPDGPALVFNELKDVGQPAASPVQRLRQMREIARAFDGELAIFNQPVAKLELISSPLHRYEVPQEGVIDGTLFSLAVGTDFEILLVIEARKDDQDKTTWQWAAARGHYHQLNLKYKDAVVWSAPRNVELEATGPGDLPYAKQSYFLLTPAERMPAPEDLK
jgi:hypothetical protein